MIPRRSKIRWTTAIAAIVVLAIAGFLIGRHDAGGGAQAQPDPPRYEPEEGGSGGHRSASDRDVIDAAELVGPEEGWAQTGSRLAWTTDGGASWSTITPPGLDPGSILAARFDGSGDGVVVACREINAAPVPLEIFRTTDDGRTWQASTLEGEGPGSIGSVRISGADGSWWLLVDEAGVASTGQRLYGSADAGKSWRETSSRPPASGPFVFFSAQEGWIVGGRGTAQAVYRTDDAGGSWEEIDVPLPGPTEAGEGTLTEPDEEGLPEEEIRTEPEGDRNRVEYGLPERGPEGILLPVTITSPAGESEVLLYGLPDGGAWRVVSTTELVGRAGINTGELTTTFIGPGELAIQDPGPHSASGPAAITVLSDRSSGSSPSRETGDFTSDVVPASGLPELAALDFVDPSHGVTVTGNICSASGCQENTQLFLTTDGGRSWSPPAARP